MELARSDSYANAIKGSRFWNMAFDCGYGKVGGAKANPPAVDLSNAVMSSIAVVARSAGR